jgi:WD40 repeat protein
MSGARPLISPYDGGGNTGRQLPSLWNTEDGSRIALLGGENVLVKAAEFTPDGSLVATVLADGSVHTWNGESGTLNRLLGKVSGAPISIAFSNNGRYLALLTEEAKIHVFNLLSGDLAPPVPLDGNPGRSTSIEEKAMFVAISDDARRFATASSVAAHVWDHRSESTSPAATDKLVQVAEIPRQYSESIDRLLQRNPPIFSPNGQLLLMASDNDLAGNAWFRMYSSIDELTNLAKSALPRCLTLDERSGFFLNPEPPAWCIEMEKWPYRDAVWKQWLAETRVGKHPSLPSGP